jgi:hypothetical protein
VTVLCNILSQRRRLQKGVFNFLEPTVTDFLPLNFPRKAKPSAAVARGYAIAFDLPRKEKPLMQTFHSRAMNAVKCDVYQL